MSIVVGIDLGTTNSCVAVPESADIPNREKLLDDGRLRPVGGALVITDSYGAPTTPSAVWLDRDGTPTVGTMAKQQARLPGSPPPAMFFKRTMGTDEKVTAGHATLTPQQASTHVLRYLKNLAEEVLGQPVERAVVTVPAFFESRARNETTQAGVDAGLEVIETLLEPVAAALTYTRSRELTEPRTFLVYDLGGGTFDASVVSWDPEIGFENRRFDGDRFLGGYEFDKRIVRWIADQLPRHDLTLDPDGSPADAKLFSRLLVVAEAEKHNLTRDAMTTIVETATEDRAGVPMIINLPLRRDTFESLIEADIKSTIDKCDRALDAAGVAADELDEIVMVGGSSRVRLVSRLLKERYHREPLMIDPDLCVAVGAALKAATAPVRSSHLQLDRPASTTAQTMIDVTGQVLGDSPAGVVVRLTSPDGMLRLEERTNPDGRFLFQDVRLREDAENLFSVSVIIDGSEVDAQRLVVSHAADSVAELDADGDVLAHDIAVELHDGREVIGPAGTKLPYRKTFPLETATQGELLRVRLYEGPVPIGAVEVRDLPRELPVGSEVQVDVEFQRGWTIRAQASVPAAGATGVANITIPQVVLPSWEALRERYAEVKAGWEDRRAVAKPMDLMRVGPQLDALLLEIEPLLSERFDRAKAHHKLQEADTLLKQIPTGAKRDLTPPWEDFEERLDTLAVLADQLSEVDLVKAQQYKDGIPGLRAAGHKAYDAKSKLDWASANEAVNRQVSAIRKRLATGQDLNGPVNVPDLRETVINELTGMVDSVRRMDELTGGRHHDEAAALITDIETVLASVRRLDPEHRDAFRDLQRIYNAQVRELRSKISRWMESVRVKEPGEEVIEVRLPGRSL